jgi:hypothetical protein
MNSLHTDAWESFKRHPVFLPSRTPVTLRGTPWDAYCEILDGLSSCNELGGSYRSYIEHHLPTSPPLTSLDDWCRASRERLLSVLSLLCHCYRCDILPQPQVRQPWVPGFPKELWLPFRRLADLCDHPYCGSLYSTTYSNFDIYGIPPGTSYDPGGVTFNDLTVVHNWLRPTWAPQLDHWVKIFVFTELQGARANAACQALIEAAEAEDENAVKRYLDDLHEGITAIMSVFSHHVRGGVLDVALWREVVQPVFGWGLATDETDPHPLEGASGLQVGCIQLIDATLGIPMTSPMGIAAIGSRRYLPPWQRSVIEYAQAKSPSLLRIVQREGSTLFDGFARCVQRLAAYRLSHLARGKLYLRGDGSPKTLESTGLSLHHDSDLMVEFGNSMQAKIADTHAGLARKTAQ